MKFCVQLAALFFLAATAQAQIQVELKFKRLQYIAHEPILATLKIANLSGRDIDLRDENGQRWFGFEINAGEGRLLAPFKRGTEPVLHVELSRRFSKINLAAVSRSVSALPRPRNVYFSDLNKFSTPRPSF